MINSELVLSLSQASHYQRHTNTVVRVCVFVELRGYQRGRLSGGSRGGEGEGRGGFVKFVLAQQGSVYSFTKILSDLTLRFYRDISPSEQERN